MKEQLYNWRDDVRPRVVGKFDEKGEWVRPHGDWLLPALSELTPAMIARVIAQRIRRLDLQPRAIEKLNARVDWINAKEKALAKPKITLERIPYFCSGCPHNTSTNVPEGSRATAGIGCHVMAIWMDRRTSTFTHMGGEGVPWIGQAPFTDEKHIFANLGDGTYYHSGSLAIRAAVAAKVNITYKILYNDAVAMTGGQPVDGPISPAHIAQQVAAEGVAKIVVVSDEPDKYPSGYFASDIEVHDRDDLDAVQRKLRETPGCTVLLYDQTCAAEKRRRRKRGKFPDPAKRVVINELVCEGCGDCGIKSNCVSVAPVETEFGRKRTIDQSSCNKDFSCVKGFCPSFVTVEGGTLRKPKKAAAGEFPDLPDPVRPTTAEPYGILVTGIGGTGVVTIGALIGMAAHLEGKGCSVLDMTGLAQKNGAVVSHVRIADTPEQIHATRIAAGEAKLVLACDILTGVGYEQLAKMQKGVTRALVNTALVMPAGFTRDPDLAFPRGSMEREIEDAVAPGDAEFLDATRLATGLMGDSIATNLFMVGFAYQRGLLPISEAALVRAIELNGTAIESNKQSFIWGRRAAIDPAHVTAAAIPSAKPESQRLSDSLDEIIARRAEYLTAYQDAAFAARYTDFVAKVARSGKGEGPRRDDADGGRGALLLQAARGEGRVRSRAPLRRDRLRGAGCRAVRGRLQAHLPPRTAGIQQARPHDRRGEKERLRPVDDARLRRAREATPFARDAARHLRQDGRAQDGTGAPRPVRSARRRAPGCAGDAQSRARGRARPDSRAHPRVWARQGSARGRGEEEGGRAAGGLPLGHARRTEDDGARRRLKPAAGTPLKRRFCARFAELRYQPVRRRSELLRRPAAA